jgi:SSS family transporter
MTNTLAVADYAIIAGFFAVMLGIGGYYSGRMRSMSQFFGGGKQVPWWLGGVSFYMVSFSALAFVMHSEMVYKYGFVSLVLSWLAVPAAALSALLFARRWRRVAETSPLEYIEARYGFGMRQSLMWLGLPTRLLDDSLKLFAIGTVVSTGLGFPFNTAVIVCAVIILGYTFMGGLWAALVADFVQFAVLVAAVLVLPALAFGRTGGIAAVLDRLPPDFFHLTRPDSGYPFAYLLCYFTLLFLNYSTSWALAQRYYSSENDRSARKVGFLVSGLYLIGTPLFYLPAFAAIVFLPGIENTKDVYPLICKTVLPVGMLGMVIAAMFSATMSTLAGDYNAASSVLTNDLYKRVIGRDLTDKHLVVVGRINTIIVGLIVLGITLVMRTLQGSGDLFNTMAKVFGLFLPPVALPMLLGMLTPRVSSRGAQLGLFGGIAAGLAVFVLGSTFPFLRKAEFLTFFTSGMTLLGMLAGSRLCPDAGDRREQVLAFFARFRDTPAQAADAKTPSDVSFLPVIAAGIAAVGLILITAVIATGGYAKGQLSVCIGLALLLVASGFWIAARRLKKTP